MSWLGYALEAAATLLGAVVVLALMLPVIVK